MTARMLGPRDYKSELKGHIEARNSWFMGVQFHPRKIVKRVAAASDETKQAVKAPLTAWYLQDRLRNQAKSTQPRNEGKVERFKPTVEWNVDKRERRVHA